MRFKRLSVGRFFVGGSAGAPVALLPHIDVVLLDPFARQPDVARMRTRPPVAGHPNPLAAPSPVTGNEPPLRRGAWWRRCNIFLVRWRRLGGLSHIRAVRRSDLWRDGNGTVDRATRQQQQAGGHQETFGWNRIFHGFKFGSSSANLVHFSKKRNGLKFHSGTTRTLSSERRIYPAAPHAGCHLPDKSGVPLPGRLVSLQGTG